MTLLLSLALWGGLVGGGAVEPVSKSHSVRQAFRLAGDGRAEALPDRLSGTLALQRAAQGASAERAEAERLARAGSYEQALQRFRRLAAADPTDLESRVWIGQLHVWMGDPATAEAVFRGVLLYDPQNLDALIGLGEVLIATGRFDEALRALAQAEKLAPDKPSILAAQGRAQRLAGRTTLALAYYRRAALLDPDDTSVRYGLEQLLRKRGHRLETTFFHESFSLPIQDTRSGDVSFEYRLSDRLRVSGRGQTQRKFFQTETRGGGGAEWRRRNVALRGHFLFGRNANVLPRVDTNGEVEYTNDRVELVGGLRYFRFNGVDVWVGSPGITYWLYEWLAVSGRYYRSVTGYSNLVDAIDHNSGAVRARARIYPRIWVEGGYASGIESFDTLSTDRLGEFEADTVSGGVRVDFPNLTSFAINYEHQQRVNDTTMQRLTASVIHRF